MKLIIGNGEVSPPQEKGVKKINVFFVKKTVLFERSEFTVFRKRHTFLAFSRKRRHFCFLFLL